MKYGTRRQSGVIRAQADQAPHLFKGRDPGAVHISLVGQVLTQGVEALRPEARPFRNICKDSQWLFEVGSWTSVSADKEMGTLLDDIAARCRDRAALR